MTLDEVTQEQKDTFNIDHYLEVERRHVERLYVETGHKYKSRAEFMFAYIEKGLAKNFQEFYFGERHLIREM